MRTTLFVLACLALVAGCRGGGGASGTVCEKAAAPTATSATPADLMDLSHWSLTLPVDSAGNHSGSAYTVPAGELTAGYSSDWFYASDRGVTFFAPIEGATTAHTLYPRSELREVLDPADYSVNWSSGDVADLAASIIVHQVPADNGKVTVAEIVGYNHDNPDINVLAKLIYEYNPDSCLATLYSITLPSPDASGSTASHQVLTRSLRLGQEFPYAVHVENHQITFSHGTDAALETIDPSWDGVGLYFRAGASLFSTGASLEDGARVTFHQLAVTHT
jgi:hypothetical protein